MIDLEMRLGKEIAEAVDKDNMVVFENETTKQTYALFKIKNEAGAVSELAKGFYIVTTKGFKHKKKGGEDGKMEE